GAYLGAVTCVPVRAGAAIGEHAVHADAATARIRRAGVTVVAGGVRAAGPAAGDRRVHTTRDRIAGIDRTRIGVVAVRCGTRDAGPGRTGLGPVADVTVVADRPVDGGGEDAAR